MRLACEVQNCRSEKAEVRDGARDVQLACERDRLAAVARLELCELLAVLFDQIRESQQKPRAIGDGCAGPRCEGFPRRAHRGIDVTLVAVGHLGDPLSCRRLDVVEVAAADRRTKLAADEISEAQGTPRRGNRKARTPIDRCRDPTSPTARSK